MKILGINGSQRKGGVFSVDAKGGVKNPKNLEQAKMLGSLVAKTLIRRKEKIKKRR